MIDIQERRSKKAVPRGRPLHDYVNLYFHARNPMLFTRRAQHAELSVLRISATVLDLPNTVISDGNAASNYTAFFPSPSGLANLNSEEVFAEWWTDPNPILELEKKRKKCAELLVPHKVEAMHILGAYVSCGQARDVLTAMGFSLPIIVDAHLFFL